MKIPGLTVLVQDVKRIADALERLAKHAEVLAKQVEEKEDKSYGCEKKYSR